MDEFDEAFGEMDRNEERRSKLLKKFRQFSIAAFCAVLVGAGIAITSNPDLRVRNQRAATLENRQEDDRDLWIRSAQIAKRIAHDELMFDLQRGGDPYALREEYRMKIEAIDRLHRQKIEAANY